MTYTMRAEWQGRLEEEYDDLEEAVARARALEAEHGPGGYSVSGEGIHLTIYEVPAEVAA